MRPARRAPRRRRGFSLIELMLSLAILAVLASVALPMLQVVRQRERERELALALREIRQAIDRWRAAVDNGQILVRPGASGYPPSLEALEEGTADQRSPTPRRLVFLRRIPRDPMNRDEGLDAAQTWGLRGSQSPPDDPRAGDDVFDVHSLVPGVGLNGVPYRQW